MYEGAIQAKSIGNGPSAYALDAPKTVPSIPMRMEELDQNTQQLHAAISDLEGRLALAMRAMPPTADGVNKNPEGPGAPLASGIREMAARVQHATRRVHEVLSRLEL